MKAVMLLALGLSVAHAAEPTGTLTLACEGTRTTTTETHDKPTKVKKPEQITMGIIIDFAARTVEFGHEFHQYRSKKSLRRLSTSRTATFATPARRRLSTYVS